MGGVRRDDGPVHVTVRSTDRKQVRKMLLEEKAVRADRGGNQGQRGWSGP